MGRWARREAERGIWGCCQLEVGRGCPLQVSSYCILRASSTSFQSHSRTGRCPLLPWYNSIPRVQLLFISLSSDSAFLLLASQLLEIGKREAKAVGSSYEPGTLVEVSGQGKTPELIPCCWRWEQVGLQEWWVALVPSPATFLCRETLGRLLHLRSAWPQHKQSWWAASFCPCVS